MTLWEKMGVSYSEYWEMDAYDKHLALNVINHIAKETEVPDRSWMR